VPPSLVLPPPTMSRSLALSLCLLLASPLVDATLTGRGRFRAIGRSNHPLLQRSNGVSIAKRAQVVGDFQSEGLDNTFDLSYTANVTVGGVDIPVVVDTGR
jgi:hypothetical protein